jgi:hypothetical protein
MTNRYEFDKVAIYEIRVIGELDPSWSEWFGDLQITILKGEMLLSGEISDQSALYGVLSKLGEMGFSLLSVNRISSRPGE